MRISSLFSVLNDALAQRLWITACGAAFARLQSLPPLATCLLVWVRTASRSLRALSSPRHQVVISTFRQARSHSMAQGQALHSRFKLATTSLATVLRASPGLVTTLVRNHDMIAQLAPPPARSMICPKTTSLRFSPDLLAWNGGIQFRSISISTPTGAANDRVVSISASMAITYVLSFVSPLNSETRIEPFSLSLSLSLSLLQYHGWNVAIATSTQAPAFLRGLRCLRLRNSLRSGPDLDAGLPAGWTVLQQQLVLLPRHLWIALHVSVGAVGGQSDLLGPCRLRIDLRPGAESSVRPQMNSLHFVIKQSAPCYYATSSSN